MKKSKSYYAIFIVLGVIVFLPLSCFIIQPFILGDECQYHNEEMNWVFNLFYDLPSWNGCHPFPTLFNLLFNIFLSAFLGFYTAKKLAKFNSPNVE